MTLFGDFAGPEDVEAAVLQTLEKWLPTYLREVERKRGLEKGFLPEIHSYSIVSDYARYPQEQLPAMTIESSGVVSGSVTRDGDGYYTAVYAVEVAVTTAAEDGVNARKGAQRYGEAVRGAIVQRRALETSIEVADWVDESLVGENVDRERHCTSVNAFEVEVTGIVSVKKGPSEPDPESTVEATVQSVEVNTEVEQ